MTQRLNPYATSRLSPEHLELLFPATFYQSDEMLSKHLSESCLVEQMTWEGDTAVGETAFWLKVLSTPETDYLKRQKRLFKLSIAERCRDISQTYSQPSSKPPAVIKLKVSEPNLYQGQHSGSIQQVLDIEPVSPSEDSREPPQILVRTGASLPVSGPQNTATNQAVLVTENADNNATQLSEVSQSAATTSVIIDQVISDNDWQVIEKHMGVTNSNAIATTTQQPATTDDMDVYDTTTPGFGIKAFKCKLCAFAADNRPALNKHQKANHADQLPYSCPECDYVSKYSWSIKTHLDSVHFKSKRFQCPDCSYATSQACFLRRHTLRKHNTEEGEHKCPYCDHTSHHPNSLQRHINRQHTHNFAHKCPYCDFGRDCKYLVEDHINEIHLKKVIYQCSECSYQTYKQRALKSHQKTHLSREVICCSDCDYKSVSLAGLSRHLKDAHPCTDAKAVLADAKRTMQTTSTVKSGGEDYTAVLMGRCKYCDFTTDNVLRLKSHIRNRHKKVSKVPCPHCKFQATNKKGLRRHMTNQHPEKQVLAIQGSGTEPTVTIAVSEVIGDTTVATDSLPLAPVEEGDADNIVTVMMTGIDTGETSQS